MQRGLVGSEMCIRDRYQRRVHGAINFTESTDSGKSWTTPFQTHPSKSHNHKFLYSIHYMPDSGRVLLFYVTRTWGERTDDKIAMISRAPGSKIFSQESIIAPNVALQNAAEKFVVALNYKNGKPYLHLFIVTKKEALLYLQSSTNGVIWTEPRQLMEEKSVAYVLEAKPDRRDPNLLALVILPHYYFEYKKPSQFIFTDDSFKTVHGPFDLGPKGTIYYDMGVEASACLFRSNNNPYLAAMAIRDDALHIFTIWDLKQKTNVTHSFPAACRDTSSVRIACGYEASDNIVDLRVTWTQRLSEMTETYLYHAHGKAVSYTHLTLPTILLVQISVVAVSLKKKKKQKIKDPARQSHKLTQETQH
eukprot:TRINITY_DN12641_c0_g1_i3.p1 TRINITY_DN12641_c0_g1~~TRINITY_DN12641_c0_g1_i3.p1  ORF type:complete len:362 (-),score=72.36 TRINITY_DN12641_c0_g1_i3:34-1119(-)